MKRELVRQYTKTSRGLGGQADYKCEPERFGSTPYLRAFDFTSVHTPSIPSGQVVGFARRKGPE